MKPEIAMKRASPETFEDAATKIMLNGLLGHCDRIGGFYTKAEDEIAMNDLMGGE